VPETPQTTPHKGRRLVRLALSWYPAALGREHRAETEAFLLDVVDVMRRRSPRWIRLRVLAYLTVDLVRAHAATLTGSARPSRPDSRPAPAMTLDVRHAWRRLRRRPAFALTAVLTVGLGIGATTAVYSVVDAVLIRPLPWQDPDRIVTVWQVRPEWRDNPVLTEYADVGTFSWPAFRALQSQQSVFAGVAAFARPRPVLRGNPNEELDALQVSSALLALLGVEPARGRAFAPDSDVAATAEVLVSHETWHNRFGGQPDILGHRVTIDDAPAVIVGVLPEGFVLSGVAPDVLLPLGRLPADVRNNGGNFLNVIARLAPGASVADAERVTTDVLRQGNPDSTRESRVNPLADEQRSQVRSPLLFVLLASSMLLFIACANAIGLLLADAESRRTEMAMRTALGAGRWRLTRLLLTEGVLLGLTGAVAGLLLATWLTPTLLDLAPASLAGWLAGGGRLAQRPRRSRRRTGRQSAVRSWRPRLSRHAVDGSRRSAG
jgi:putative ABC transport system permease protein